MAPYVVVDNWAVEALASGKAVAKEASFSYGQTLRTRLKR
jgi:hypothetical protein